MKKQCARCLKSVKAIKKTGGPDDANRLIRAHKCFEDLSDRTKVRVFIKRQDATGSGDVLQTMRMSLLEEPVTLQLPPADPEGYIQRSDLDEEEETDFTVEARWYYLALLSVDARP